MHVIDAQREDDWEVLLMREGSKEGMFGAACPFPFAQDSPENGISRSMAVHDRAPSTRRESFRRRRRTDP
jgi:hypothetical protein